MYGWSALNTIKVSGQKELRNIQKIEALTKELNYIKSSLNYEKEHVLTNIGCREP